MKYFLIVLCFMLVLPCLASAEDGEFVLTATVAADESALLSLPIDGAETVLALSKGDALTVTELGSAYCTAYCGETAGYVALGDLAFDVMDGKPTQLGEVDVAPTNTLSGRMTLRAEASTKSASLCQMAKGRLLLIIGEENGMYHVAFPGYIGYGTKKNINTEVEPMKYKIAYVKNDDPVHLRLDDRYGDRFAVTRLDPGTPVQFFKNPNGWAHVEAAGHRGRMLAKYLSFDAP